MSKPSDANNNVVTVSDLSGPCVCLLAPLLFSFAPIKSFMYDAVKAIYWGEQVPCSPSDSSQSIVFNGLRVVDKAPLYLTPQKDGSTIISNESLSLGQVYSCVSYEDDVAFIYSSEDKWNLLNSYDRNAHVATMIGLFGMFILGVISMPIELWRIYGKKIPFRGIKRNS